MEVSCDPLADISAYSVQDDGPLPEHLHSSLWHGRLTNTVTSQALEGGSSAVLERIDDFQVQLFSFLEEHRTSMHAEINGIRSQLGVLCRSMPKAVVEDQNAQAHQNDFTSAHTLNVLKVDELDDSKGVEKLNDSENSERPPPRFAVFGLASEKSYVAGEDLPVDHEDTSPVRDDEDEAKRSFSIWTKDSGMAPEHMQWIQNLRMQHRKSASEGDKLAATASGSASGENYSSSVAHAPTWLKTRISSGHSVLTLNRRARCYDHSVMIEPTSMFRNVWDVMTIVALTSDAVIIPLAMAWQFEATTILKATMYASVLFWTLDIVMSFNTGYLDDGDIEMRRCRVVMRYARRTLIVDLTICAIDWLNISLESRSSKSGSVTAVRLLRLNRLLRIITLLRVVSVSDRLQQLPFLPDDMSVYQEISKLFFIILFLNHFLSCAWYAIGDHNGLRSWLDEYVSTKEEGTYRDSDMLYQYTTAYHWSMTQITAGSMQVFPQNSYERMFNIFYLLLGLLFCTSLVSRLSAIMVQLSMSKAKDTKARKLLRRYLRENHVSPQLAQRVERHITTRTCSRRALTAADVPTLALLSKPLRAELSNELYKPHLMRIPIFAFIDKADVSVLKSVCQYCGNLQLVEGDELFGVGMEAQSSFLIRQGIMTYTCDLMKSSSAQVHPGAHILPMILWAKWITKGTLHTITTCEVIELPIKEVMPEILKYSALASLVLHYGKQYRKTMRQIPREEVTDINSCVDHVIVIRSLPEPHRTRFSLLVLATLQQQSSLWYFWKAESLKKLEQEVDQGKSTLIFNNIGEPIRVVSLVALHIKRLGGEILVQLAEKEDDEFKAMCVLPGAKIRKDETAMVAGQRILADLILHMRPQILDAGSTEHTDQHARYNTMTLRNELAMEEGRIVNEDKRSASYGINTQYRRLVYTVRTDISGRPPPRLPPPEDKGTGAIHFTHVRTVSSEAYHSEDKDGPMIDKRDSEKSLDRDDETIPVAMCLQEHEDDHMFQVQRANGSVAIYAWMWETDFESLCSAEYAHCFTAMTNGWKSRRHKGPKFFKSHSAASTKSRWSYLDAVFRGSTDSFKEISD